MSEKWSTSVGEDGVFVTNEYGLVAEVHGDCNTVEDILHARLIAAAPDLLEACKQVDSMAGTLMDELGKGPATNWGVVNKCLCDCARAIAKAEEKS